MNILRFITTKNNNKLYIYRSTKLAIVKLSFVIDLHLKYITTATPIVAKIMIISIMTKPAVEELGLQYV